MVHVQRRSHAGAAACGEVELVTSARPGSDGRERAPVSRELGPGDALHSHVPRGMSGLDRDRTISLNEAYENIISPCYSDIHKIRVCTVEAAGNSSVVRCQRDRDGQLCLVLRRRGERNRGGLNSGNLAPVDGEEDSLLRRARRNRALGRRDLHPRRVAGHCEREWGGASSADVYETVPSRDEWIDGEGGVSAAVAQRAVELVVSRPTKRCINR